MHPYSNDSGRRQQTIVAICALTGLLAAFGLGIVFDLLKMNPPWWLDTPAAFGCFGIIWTIYDRWAWRLKIGHTSISGILDLSGEWSGEISSNYNCGTTMPARMKIRQTSTRISIIVMTDHSISHSNMASACSAEGANQGLRYAYSNRPRTLTPSGMVPHQGMAHLISPEGIGQELTGDYEADRHRRTHGRMKFKYLGRK